MVAPSFQKFTIIGEVYNKGNKAYIQLRNEKTGHVREARWYTATEYARIYGKQDGNRVKTTGESIDEVWEFYWTKEGGKGLKHARGFDKGFITILRGLRNQEDEEWCKLSIARYATDVGWYFASTDNIPHDLPAHFTKIVLTWDEFRDKDNYHRKRPSQLQKIIAQKYLAF